MKAGIYAASVLRDRCESLGLLSEQDTLSREAVAEGNFHFFSQRLLASYDREQSSGGRCDHLAVTTLKHAATDVR